MANKSRRQKLVLACVAAAAVVILGKKANILSQARQSRRTNNAETAAVLANSDQAAKRDKKTIWIMNHYATAMFFSEGGRHYWFAEKLKERGYNPVIFCCNVKHNRDGGRFFEDSCLYSVHTAPSGVPFVVIDSTLYEGNGAARIANMAVFARNLVSVSEKLINDWGQPDIILASSVHPLTVLAGEQVAKRHGIPCVCEVRDLWPESIFAYYPEKRNSPYASLLRAGEKRMYKNADSIIMTWAGGAQYIQEMGWEDEVPLSKVTHICNGVDLKGFNENLINHPYEDSDLSDCDAFKVVYTGSIRRVNKVGMLVNVAELLEQNGNPNHIRILIWGSGDEVESIERQIADKALSNIVIKGRVAKQFIPSILSQSDCCILQYASTELDKYGQSQNKLFEYLASGRPILMTYHTAYNIIDAYDCGVCLEEQSPEAIAAALNEIASYGAHRIADLSSHALKAAHDYDFDVLTDKLIAVLGRVCSDAHN